MKAFGKELRKIREERGLTQVEFAKKLSVSRQVYGDIERGTVKGITKNMRMIAKSDVLTGVEKQSLAQLVGSEPEVETFGDELKRIREKRQLTQVEFSKQLRVNPGTYHAVESGAMSAYTDSAKRIRQSNVFSREEKQRFERHLKKEQEGALKITDEQRLEYRRRKNAQFFKEKPIEAPKNNRSFKRGVSRSVIQKVFY